MSWLQHCSPHQQSLFGAQKQNSCVTSVNVKVKAINRPITLSKFLIYSSFRNDLQTWGLWAVCIADREQLLHVQPLPRHQVQEARHPRSCRVQTLPSHIQLPVSVLWGGPGHRHRPQAPCQSHAQGFVKVQSGIIPSYVILTSQFLRCQSTGGLWEVCDEEWRGEGVHMWPVFWVFSQKQVLCCDARGVQTFPKYFLIHVSNLC